MDLFLDQLQHHDGRTPAPVLPETGRRLPTWTPFSVLSTQTLDLLSTKSLFLQMLMSRLASLMAIRMHGVGPAKEFRLKLGDRLTVIAGDNGLGKSLLLNAIWWASTG